MKNNQKIVVNILMATLTLALAGCNQSEAEKSSNEKIKLSLTDKKIAAPGSTEDFSTFNSLNGIFSFDVDGHKESFEGNFRKAVLIGSNKDRGSYCIPVNPRNKTKMMTIQLSSEYGPSSNDVAPALSISIPDYSPEVSSYSISGKFGGVREKGGVASASIGHGRWYTTAQAPSTCQITIYEDNGLRIRGSISCQTLLKHHNYSSAPAVFVTKYTTNIINDLELSAEFECDLWKPWEHEIGQK